MAEETVSPELLDRARKMVDRAIQRNIRALEFLAGPPIRVGLTPKDVIYKRGTLRLYHYHWRTRSTGCPCSW